MRTGFDGDGLMDDVAFDLRGRGQAHLDTTQPTDDAAIHDHLVGQHLAANRGGIADGQLAGADIALDGAFDLDIAGGLKITLDGQIRGQDRGGRALLRRCGDRSLFFGGLDRGQSLRLAGAPGAVRFCVSVTRDLENILSCLDEPHGIYGFAVHPNLIMKMGTGRPSSISHITDLGAARYLLTGPNTDL